MILSKDDKQVEVQSERYIKLYKAWGWQEVKETKKQKVDDYHTGAGWYEINGERVRGKENAEELLKE